MIGCDGLRVAVARTGSTSGPLAADVERDARGPVLAALTPLTAPASRYPPSYRRRRTSTGCARGARQPAPEPVVVVTGASRRGRHVVAANLAPRSPAAASRLSCRRPQPDTLPTPRRWPGCSASPHPVTVRRAHGKVILALGVQRRRAHLAAVITTGGPATAGCSIRRRCSTLTLLRRHDSLRHRGAVDSSSATRRASPGSPTPPSGVELRRTRRPSVRRGVPAGPGVQAVLLRWFCPGQCLRPRDRWRTSGGRPDDSPATTTSRPRHLRGPARPDAVRRVRRPPVRLRSRR